MSIDINDREAVEDRLWSEIENEHVGMLAVVDGEPQHFQPMMGFAERDQGLVWFFTHKDTDLAQDAETPRQAMFVLQAHNREMQACISGELTTRLDRERLDRFWSPHVDAWFPKGKDDPQLTMLCLACEDARVWISDAGPLRYAWEIARANTVKEQPDLGGRTDVRL